MIITDNTILRKVSNIFTGTDKELNDLFKLLDKELNETKMIGVGLSAIQINIPYRVAIIRTNTISINLHNAVILEGSGSKIDKEGCLSLPNQFIDVERKTKITVKNGDGKIYILKDFVARVVQHELDHFDGIMITDRRV